MRGAERVAWRIVAIIPQHGTKLLGVLLMLPNPIAAMLAKSPSVIRVFISIVYLMLVMQDTDLTTGISW